MSLEQSTRDVLVERIEALEARVDALEATDDTSQPDHDSADPRDRRVLDCLQDGQDVTADQLASIYRQETDVRNPSTVKARVKDLTRRPSFDQDGLGRWTYTGGGE